MTFHTKSLLSSFTGITILVLIVALTLIFNTDQQPIIAQDNPVGPVYVISGDGIIEEPANFFDLEGRTIRYTPEGDGYRVENVPFSFSDQQRTRLNDSGAEFFGAITSWSRPLPFSFPFAGQTWDRVFVNLNGNLTFETSEAASWSARDPWAGGTMNLVSNAITGRAMQGEEFMIAGLWGLYEHDSADIFVSSSGPEFVVTWNLTRDVDFNVLYEPLGRNEFQIRLQPSGVIELSYREVAERDGLAGLITGQAPQGELVDTVTDRRGDSPEAVADITQVDVYDAGDVVRFVFTIATTVPTRIDTGRMWYRVFIQNNNRECEFNLGVFQDGFSPGSSCGESGASAQGNQVTLNVPKAVLDNPSQIRWSADVGWWDFPRQGDFIGDEVGSSNAHTTNLLAFEPADLDLSEASGPQTQLLEVFHYPVVPKQIQEMMTLVFARAPDTEMAMVLTDFRMDDLYGHGGSTGGVNIPLQGAGEGLTEPLEGEQFGSNRLQVAAQPVFVGQQRFDEVIQDGNQTFIHHAGAVGWMAHELGHRWGVSLRFRHPNTGEEVALSDMYCNCHWAEALDTASMIRVGDHYIEGGYATENSPMGGFEWRSLGGDRYSQEFPPYLTPYGFSALDLYAMGLIPASDVPDTFMLENLEHQSGDVWTGDRLDISIDDIMAAEGSRIPNFENAQKEFELTLYVVYDPAQGSQPEMIQRAMRIAGELKDYFERATGNRMSITLGGDVTDPTQVSTASGNPSAGGDSDGDGVPDEDDLCPTFAGSPAADGC